MIYTNIAGRCGNQMFDYAFSRKLQEIYGDSICFNFYHINKHDDPHCEDLLKYFNVNKYIINNSKNNLIFKYGNIFQIMMYCIYKILIIFSSKNLIEIYKKKLKWQRILNIFGIYTYEHIYGKPKKTIFKNKFVDGNFEDKRFFDSIRNILIKEFTPKQDIKSYNLDLFNVIKNEESVCISFRRTDFLSEKHSALRNICSEKYYFDAMKIMKEKKPNCVFVFFSDDIEWVKKQYSGFDNCYFESGKDNVAETIRLMSNCKNFIMANSTFCWWAQYLSTNRNKIVISPDHWININNYQHSLIDNNWILIKC